MEAFGDFMLKMVVSFAPAIIVATVVAAIVSAILTAIRQ